MKTEEKCDKVEKENLRSFHNVLLENLHHHETDLLKFLGILLTSLGGFGLALQRYLQDTQDTDKYLPLIVLAVIISLMLLGWGIFFALALSYNHRYIQRVMSKFENRMCFYESNLLPPRWNLDRRLKNKECRFGSKEFLGKFFWDIAPSIYRVHIVFFILGILAICFSTLFINRELTWLAISEGAIIFLLSGYINSRYWHKLKRLYSQESSP